MTNLSNQFPSTAATLTPLSDQNLIAPNLVNPYYQRYSIGLQRELPYNTVLDVSYVGSKGTKLFIQEDYNPNIVNPALRSAIPAGYPNCTPNQNITAAQATPRFPAGTLCPLSGRLDNLQGARTVRTNGGSSSYHSGQLEVRRRFADNFLLTGAYTFSKLIDNGSEVFGVGVSTSTANAALPTILGGDRLERAVGNFYRPHRASFSYVVESPFFREQRGPLGRILGGFQISGVTAFESGVPYTVFNGLNSDGIAGALERPNFNANGQRGVRAIPVVNAQGFITGYTNPDASNAPIDPATAQFIVNPVYNPALPGSIPRFSSLGRNTERSPGVNNFNVNLLKRTSISENTFVEFRTEFYNIFNHPQYLTGSVSPFSPAGGSIDSSATAAAAGRFLNPNTPATDGGGRVIRYEVKLIF